ncbi:MAG TPA: DMT family transporter [Marmoricola sp.]|nr:DMT family transporter [Marmoricola sp.]HNI70429.1 DMT family transporter [Marmoricola sp.]HNJ79681.1 DMT family transporter [Marmoricola sp.]HNN49059.1 DMT family transporter [Marmoricola sp.]HNO38801.1 DMT family transporter [Marmoricola sp.]
MPAHKTPLATLALLAMTACWGSTFFLIHDLLDRIPVADFLSIRFIIASLAMLVLAPRAIGRLDPNKRRHALVLGLLYGLAQVLQTAGLAHTAASVSGFITGFYVVATPFFAAWILRTRIGPLTWVAVAVAIAGIGILTLGDVGGVQLGYGEALTFVAALIYALHIIGLGAWSTAADAVGMAIIQAIIIAAITTIAAVPGGITLPSQRGDWLSIAYMAIFAGALALLGQTWAQAHLSPTRSAVIMSMEPVFATFFAVLFGGESFTLKMLIGGSLVVTAMVLVELRPGQKPESELPHLQV